MYQSELPRSQFHASGAHIDQEIAKSILQGYQITTRNDDSVTLIKPRRGAPLWVVIILGIMLTTFGIGPILIGLTLIRSRGKILRLTLDADGYVIRTHQQKINAPGIQRVIGFIVLVVGIGWLGFIVHYVANHPVQATAPVSVCSAAHTDGSTTRCMSLDHTLTVQEAPSGSIVAAAPFGNYIQDLHIAITTNNGQASTQTAVLSSADGKSSSRMWDTLSDAFHVAGVDLKAGAYHLGVTGIDDNGKAFDIGSYDLTVTGVDGSVPAVRY